MSPSVKTMLHLIGSELWIQAATWLFHRWLRLPSINTVSAAAAENSLWSPPRPPSPSYHTADWYQRDGPTRKNQFEGMRALVELSAWEWMMLGWLSIQPVIGWTRRWRRPLHLRVRTLEQAEFTGNGVTQHLYVGYSPLFLSWIIKSCIMLYAWVLPNMQDSLILHISVSVEVAIWN